jgi:hypothetical protein
MHVHGATKPPGAVATASSQMHESQWPKSSVAIGAALSSLSRTTDSVGKGNERGQVPASRQPGVVNGEGPPVGELFGIARHWQRPPCRLHPRSSPPLAFAAHPHRSHRSSKWHRHPAREHGVPCHPHGDSCSACAPACPVRPHRSMPPTATNMNSALHPAGHRHPGRMTDEEGATREGGARRQGCRRGMGGGAGVRGW